MKFKKFLKMLGWNLLVAIIGLTTLLPFLWMISASFMETGKASVYPPKLLPERFTLKNYYKLFSSLDMGRYFANSCIISFVVVLISLFLNSLAGYAFAKLSFPGRDKIFRLLLSSMIIPGQVAMLPLFLFMNKLGLVNTYFGVIIPGMTSVFGIFMFRQYVLTIPDSLIEAARIDGANDFEIYFKIILPICKPIIITHALFTFIGTWNDFMWPLIIMTDDSMYTLPVAIANLVGEHVQDSELMMSASAVTVAPAVILFSLVQKYYMQGILSGSLKE